MKIKMPENKLKKQLKDAGLKATPARLSILGAFSDKCHPRSAEDIYDAYKGAGKSASKNIKKEGIDLVTVYRTIASFEEAGILREVDLRKGARYYELNGHHHHHITCEKCGLVEELDGCDAENISSKIIDKSHKFKAIKGHSFEFFGTCKACARA